MARAKARRSARTEVQKCDDRLTRTCQAISLSSNCLSRPLFETAPAAFCPAQAQQRRWQSAASLPALCSRYCRKGRWQARCSAPRRATSTPRSAPMRGTRQPEARRARCPIGVRWHLLPCYWGTAPPRCRGRVTSSARVARRAWACAWANGERVSGLRLTLPIRARASCSERSATPRSAPSAPSTTMRSEPLSTRSVSSAASLSARRARLAALWPLPPPNREDKRVGCDVGGDHGSKVFNWSWATAAMSSDVARRGARKVEVALKDEQPTSWTIRTKKRNMGCRKTIVRTMRCC